MEKLWNYGCLLLSPKQKLSYQVYYYFYIFMTKPRLERLIWIDIVTWDRRFPWCLFNSSANISSHTKQNLPRITEQINFHFVKTLFFKAYNPYHFCNNPYCKSIIFTKLNFLLVLNNSLYIIKLIDWHKSIYMTIFVP